MTPEQRLGSVAASIGLEEFERNGAPETVRPRHYAAARVALEACSDVLLAEARSLAGGVLVGARGEVLRTAADSLSEAADAPGPDRPEGA